MCQKYIAILMRINPFIVCPIIFTAHPARQPAEPCAHIWKAAEAISLDPFAVRKCRVATTYG